MKTIELTGEIWQEGNMYTAYCHELDLYTAGRTFEEARKNLGEVIEIFFEETKSMGTLHQLLEEAGFDLDAKDSSLLSPRAKFCSFEKLNFSVADL